MSKIEDHFYWTGVRLECAVDRLGPMVLSWRRLDNVSMSSAGSYLATGRLVMVADPRVQVRNIISNIYLIFIYLLSI